MNFVVRNFLRGLVITVPLALTAWIAWRVFTAVDRLIAFPFPGAGFLVTIAGVFVVGVLGSNFFVRSLLDLAERLFTRAPILRIVYSAIKDLTEAFVGDRRRFDRPVVVDFPETGFRACGFVTRSSSGVAPLDGWVAVYFPQSYNIAGNLLLVRESRVTPLKVEASQLMTFLMSGGVSGL